MKNWHVIFCSPLSPQPEVSLRARIVKVLCLFVAFLHFNDPTRKFVNLPRKLPDSAFTASSVLNNQSTAAHSRRIAQTDGHTKTSWYAKVQEPHQWIQVDFGVAKLLDTIILSPSVENEYIKYSTIYCGLNYFSVRAIGRFRMHEAETATFRVGLRYCRTVRLIVHDWEIKIAVRWKILEAPGL